MKLFVILFTIALFLSTQSVNAEETTKNEFTYSGTWEVEGEINRKGYLEITNCEINVE